MRPLFIELFLETTESAQVASAYEVHEGDGRETAVGVAAVHDLGRVDALEIGSIHRHAFRPRIIAHDRPTFVQVGGVCPEISEVVVHHFPRARKVVRVGLRRRAGVIGTGALKQVEVGSAIVEGRVICPGRGLAGLVIGVEAVSAVFRRETEFHHMHRHGIGNLVLRLTAPAADFEPVAVSAIHAVIIGPAVVKGDRRRGVDTIIAVVAIVPGTAEAEGVADTAGVTTESIDIPRGDAGDSDQIVSIAVFYQRVGGGFLNIITDRRAVIYFDMAENIAVAAVDSKGLGLLLSSDLDAGHAKTLKRIIGPRDEEGAHPFDCRYAREIEYWGFAGERQIADATFVQGMNVVVGGVGTGDGKTRIGSAAQIHNVSGSCHRLGLGDAFEGSAGGAGVTVAAVGCDVVGGGEGRGSVQQKRGARGQQKPWWNDRAKEGVH